MQEKIKYPPGKYPRTQFHLDLLAQARAKITPASIEKMRQSRKGQKLSEEHKQKLSLKFKGRKISDEQKELLRKIKTGLRHTEETKEKIRRFNLGKKRPLCCGELHPFWKGGVTSEYKKIRKSPEYASWRISVFERDNYTCVLCEQKGGVLEADHIKPFALFPELRLDINNGRTLCQACHRKTDTWGMKGKSKKELQHA